MKASKNIRTNTRNQVIRHLDWNKEELNVAVYDLALEWLNHTINEDVMGIDALVRCPHFWGWWKLQWHLVDRKLLGFESPPALSSVERYLEAHSPAVMNVFPGRAVLERSYGRMMGRVIDWSLEQEPVKVVVG